MRERPHPAPRQVAANGSEWQRLLCDQHGVIDTGQLAEFGISSDVIKANVRAGRWRPMLPGVYVTATGPPTRPARLHAALRYARPAALLSHRTAAEEWGMVRQEDGPVHVTVPYGCSAVSQLPHVVVHRSRAFAHLVAATVPPRTARPDTVIDVAAAEPTAQAAMRCFVGLLTSSTVHIAEVQRRLVERPPARYRRALAAALQRVAGGVGSVLEDLFVLDVERAHAARCAAPGAVRGRRSHPVGGRRLRPRGRPAHGAAGWLAVPLGSTDRVPGPATGQRGRTRGACPAHIRLARCRPRPVWGGSGGPGRPTPARVARANAALPTLLVSA